MSTDDGGTTRACAVSTTSQPCLDATTHSDLAWIQDHIFTASCVASGCHDGAVGEQSIVDLRSGMSYAHLVGFTSHLDPSRKLVVANDVNASYLMLMLGDVSPATATPPVAGIPAVGLMPQNQPTLCCQKFDAIERWINAGAPTQ